MQRNRCVRISSFTWLAKYTFWGNGYQSCAAPDGSSMSYTSANVGVSFKTKLSTTRWCACVGRKEMAPKELLWSACEAFKVHRNLGESVRVRLPGEKVWSPAECVGFAGPRNYLVKTGDAVYRRNRRDLLSTEHWRTACYWSVWFACYPSVQSQ